MNITPASIAVCNQKGGVGKSTFTVLLASYLHYIVGHDVLVVDCDYPQWSIHAQQERELSLIEHDDYHKLCKYPFYYIFFRGIRKYMG